MSQLSSTSSVHCRVRYNDEHYPCETSLAMSLIGGKWKSVILYHLLTGTMRYSNLRRAIPDISERTLSLQLKSLEADGLVKRTATGDKPPLHVTYQLTDIGESVRPVISAIMNWGSLIKQPAD